MSTILNVLKESCGSPTGTGLRRRTMSQFEIGVTPRRMPINASSGGSRAEQGYDGQADHRHRQAECCGGKCQPYATHPAGWPRRL